MSRWASYLIAAISVAAITVVLIPLRTAINSTTIGFGFLLGVLFIAIIWGSMPALFASVLAMLCFNFFFLPPYYTFTIADSQNWAALTAFFITALAVGQLSARAKQRAEIAETRGHKIELLYEELRDAFERASEAEALRRSERLKTALLEAVTHDLRTPLTSIKASATLLLDESKPSEPQETFTHEEQQTMLRVISEEADRLDQFVESIVDLARIEAGDIRLRRNWGPVDEIIDAAIARAESLIQNHQVNVFIERELPVIRADAQAVAEVVYTLIDNATKYAPPGSYIALHADRAPNEMVKIAVEDQGPGIPPHLRQRVFEKFFRGNETASSSQRVEGIGMGLSIAKGIVEAHDGRIWIDDGADGRGTRVSFTVPVGDVDEPRPVDARMKELMASDSIEVG
ncbi:MAG TPA: DUF4118 domain-containing protein [Pyrinomonadaceae bacterium]|nr:DUF4118 domain-containing protein [Pyrinomonadaceae bacterium]